jgi:hypothetical protein
MLIRPIREADAEAWLNLKRDARSDGLIWTLWEDGFVAIVIPPTWWWAFFKSGEARDWERVMEEWERQKEIHRLELTVIMLNRAVIASIGKWALKWKGSSGTRSGWRVHMWMNF